MTHYKESTSTNEMPTQNKVGISLDCKQPFITLKPSTPSVGNKAKDCNRFFIDSHHFLSISMPIV